MPTHDPAYWGQEVHRNARITENADIDVGDRKYAVMLGSASSNRWDNLADNAIVDGYMVE